MTLEWRAMTVHSGKCMCNFQMMWNFDPGGMEPSSNDLPLMANIRDIRVSHYFLDLKVSMENRVLAGSVTLFLERPSTGGHGDSLCDGKSSSVIIPKPVSVASFETLENNASQSNSGGNKNKVCISGQLGGPSIQMADETSATNISLGGNKSKPSDTCLSNDCITPGPLSVNTSRTSDFEVILDCCDIDVHSVEEVLLSGCDSCCAYIRSELAADEKSGLTSQQHTTGLSEPCSTSSPGNSHSSKCSHRTECDFTCGTVESSLNETFAFKPNEFALRRSRFLACHTGKGRSVQHKVEPWCVKIWKEGIKSIADFPAIICINYSTRKSGKSLTWANDQDGSPCVFTQGAWINNRSLFPCQEPPGAMATWQAIIQAPEDFLVLMSGDQEGEVIKRANGLVSTLHYTDMPQPSSIVAIAVGRWTAHGIPVCPPHIEPELKADQPSNLFTAPPSRINAEKQPVFPCDHDAWPCRIRATDQPVLPSRIIAPPSLLAACVGEFADYLQRCLKAVFTLLGAHPFPRLDLLILPRCFASLGLASPCIIFLSQSLLSGSGSLLPRLAHEISHSWFGILIGARDWTEEWLSEGFATFMEDSIHALAQEQWTSKQYRDWSSLRGLLRLLVLKAEVENTESELQIMRPTGERAESSPSSRSLEVAESRVAYVKNALNPDKWFLQVHYLKGYFLLRHLASHLSMDNMLDFMNLYVHRCHGQLVLSQDIFRLLFAEYPELMSKGITMETIYSEWLDKPGLPAGLTTEMFSEGNDLISAVKAELNCWIQRDMLYQRSKSGSKRKKLGADETFTSKLIPDQLVLLLEYLLEAEAMATRTLEELHTTYRLGEQNTEVRHRWCELVVKHKHMAGYCDVRQYLLEDQAMGVYLYGELMASEDAQQQALARECFHAVAMEMDRGCYRTVHEMVFGVPAERE